MRDLGCSTGRPSRPPLRNQLLAALLTIGSHRRAARAALQCAPLWAVLVASACATGSSPVTGTGTPAATPPVVEVRDERLRTPLEVLLAGSPRVARALRGLGPDARIRVHSYRTARLGRGVAGRFAYGYTQAFFGDGGVVDSVDVAVDWDGLVRAASSLDLDAAALRRDAAVLLGHELFGHAVPLLREGSWRGECRDILENGASCSVPRENAVRADLGVDLRPDYLLVCLAVSVLRDEGIAVSRQAAEARCAGEHGVAGAPSWARRVTRGS